jgi:hypothetical protein
MRQLDDALMPEVWSAVNQTFIGSIGGASGRCPISRASPPVSINLDRHCCTISAESGIMLMVSTRLEPGEPAMSALVRINPAARTELHRTIIALAGGKECDWCGDKRSRLFQ